MFRNARIGAKVFVVPYQCDGKIISTTGRGDRPIIVEYEENGIFVKQVVTVEGMLHKEHKLPFITWQPVSFEIPEKPFDLKEFLSRFKPKEFVKDKKNYSIIFELCGKVYRNPYHMTYETYTIYFDEKTVEEIIETLNEKNVNFKDYKKAVKELGWL